MLSEWLGAVSRMRVCWECVCEWAGGVGWMIVCWECMNEFVGDEDRMRDEGVLRMLE